MKRFIDGVQLVIVAVCLICEFFGQARRGWMLVLGLGFVFLAFLPLLVDDAHDARDQSGFPL